MRTKWVLVGFGILYLAVALAFLPSEIWRSSPIEGIWEVLTIVVMGGMTIISIGLLETLTPRTICAHRPDKAVMRRILGG